MRTRATSWIQLFAHRWLRDERGAVALEFPFVWFFLAFSLLLPLADVALAGFQFITAWAALRHYGEYLQYHAPTDVTSTSTWLAALPGTDAGYTISTVTVICGDTNAACTSATAAATPKSYTFSTSLTLSPFVLSAVLCSTSCTYTLHYSERFQ